MNKNIPLEKRAKINFFSNREKEKKLIFSIYFIRYLLDQIINEVNNFLLFIRVYFFKNELKKYALKIKKYGYLVINSGYLYNDINIDTIIQECEGIKDKCSDVIKLEGSIRYKRLEKYSSYIQSLTVNKRWIDLNYLYTFKKNVPVTMLSETYKIPDDTKEQEIFAEYPHFDIYKYQLKFALALTNIEIDNGPIEILPRTSSYQFGAFISYFSSWLAINKVMTDTKNFLSDKFIKKFYIISSPKKLTLKKGDLLIFDTRNFHKATKIISGERKILWFYF